MTDYKRHQYNHAVMGGTFDKLHHGHTLLIKTACTVAKTVSIGLTSTKYLEKYPKKYSEKLYPYDYRLEQLNKFIHSLSPEFNFFISPIDHPWDNISLTIPELDCIIVSEETLKTADIINKERRKNSLQELAIVVIPGVLSAKDGFYLSSTHLRSQQ